VRIGIIAPPFISVPPAGYGGTELFIDRLARGLKEVGVEVVVYTNGQSTVPVEKRWIYAQSHWPIAGGDGDALKELEHTTWAVHDASLSCDIFHVNNVQGVTCSRFVKTPFVCTIHHPPEPLLTELYKRHPRVEYVAISEFQNKRHPLRRKRTIHHGMDVSNIHFRNASNRTSAFSAGSHLLREPTWQSLRQKGPGSL
jgi:hypothetical protein